MSITRSFRLIALLAIGCGGDIEGGGGAVDAGPLTNIPNLASIAITPADQTIVIDGDTAASLVYKAEGTFMDGHKEDITSRVRFSLDNVGLGGFSGNVFTSFTANGGYAQVQASAGFVRGLAQLTVQIKQRYTDPRETGLPADPGGKFGGPASAARNPRVVYPGDGVLVPPNLGRLELHWEKGAAQNTLFELSFQSRTTDVKIYVGCRVPLGAGCGWTPESKAWRWIAESNRGSTVTVTARGTDAQGSAVGTSASTEIDFSADDIDGAVYYWTTPAGEAGEDSAKAAIHRWDFASTTQAEPEVVVTPEQTGGHCVGCHSLSPSGERLFVTSEGSYDAYVLLFDTKMKQPIVPWNSTDNVAWASWEWPDGDRFVGTFADNNEARFRSFDLNVYDFRGVFQQTIDVDGSEATPSAHPDWAPDGSAIAYTRVGASDDTAGGSTRHGLRASLRMVRSEGNGWSAPIALTAPQEGHSRYYPTFAPDSKLVLFNHSACGDGEDGGECNMDADPGAALWIMKPEAGATQVRLTSADRPGITDSRQVVMNSFPKWAPHTFRRTGELGSRLFWFTFSTNRAMGLRAPDPGETLIWMAGVDPDACLRGEDGSFPAFALPFQDLKRDNHTAQWTKRVIKLE